MRGEWIEICAVWFVGSLTIGLSPCGESGLKFDRIHQRPTANESLPMRGEWIEMVVP